MAKILPKSIPTGGLPQSVVIFGVLIFLFVVYVTSKGQLTKYLNVLGLANTASTTSSAISTATTSATNAAKSLGGSLTGFLNTGSVASVTSGLTSGLSGIASQGSSALASLNVQPLSVSALPSGIGSSSSLNLFAGI